MPFAFTRTYRQGFGLASVFYQGVNMKTYLIVPAWSDQSGQCRIVAIDRDIGRENALHAYRGRPDAWHEVGLMNSSGKLVCLTAPDAVTQEFKDCEPLMAGMQLVG
jgi:hypothetical protein